MAKGSNARISYISEAPTLRPTGVVVFATLQPPTWANWCPGLDESLEPLVHHGARRSGPLSRTLGRGLAWLIGR